MKSEHKTKEQLVNESPTLSQQAAELEKLKAEHKRITEELREARAELAIRVKVRTAEIAKINEDLQKEITERRRIEEALRESEKRFRDVADNAIASTWEVDSEGRYTYISPVIEKILGYKPEEMLGKYNYDFFHPDDREQLKKAAFEIFAQRGRFRNFINRNVHKDDHGVILETSGVPIIDKDGKLCGYRGVDQDITERVTKDELLNYRLEFERLIVSISTDFIGIRIEEIDNEINYALQRIGEFVGVDRSYVFLFCDDTTKMDNTHEWCAKGIEPQIQKLKGLSAKNFPWWASKLYELENIYIPRVADLPAEASSEKEILEAQGIKSLIVVPMTYSGSLMGFLGFDSVRTEKVWMEEHIALLRIAGDIFANALQRKKTEEQIVKKEHLLTDIFNSIQDGISILDNELNIMRVNQTMEQWYMHAMPLVGKKCYEAYHNRNKPCTICPTCRTIKSGEAAYEVVPKMGLEGEYVGWLDLYSFPLFDTATGKMIGVIEYVRDITERKEAEKKLEILNKELSDSNRRLKQLALRDSHTGLYNYRYLEDVIEAEFYRARRYAHPLSVVMLDIDYFKSINDVYGHPFGDLVLKQLAQQMKRMVRRYDIVIRFGGEEFIIVSPGTERSQALNLAQRLLDAFNLYNFGNKEHAVKLKLSIAVVSYPEDKAAKGMDLIELAQQMLNKIKEDGGNKVYSSLDVKKGKSFVPETRERSADVNLLKGKLDKLYKQANQSLMEAIFAFAKTIELKDHYTGEHVERTVRYATETAKALGLSKDDIGHIRQAAMLHDLGKIGISENILLKKSKLTKKEFETIKKHPQIGVDIIRPIQFLQSIIPLIFYHHERWDGKGYPSGLKGEDIPIGARVIAIADVYQALISDRPYRKAYPKAEAIKIIKDGSGTQFDPQVVNALLKILKKENASPPF